MQRTLSERSVGATTLHACDAGVSHAKPDLADSATALHAHNADALYCPAQVPLPEDVPWWDAFGAKTQEVLEVVRTLHDLYKRPKTEYTSVLREAPQRQKAVTPEVSWDGMLA